MHHETGTAASWLGHHLQRLLPEALLQPGWRGIAWWQWLAIPALFVISVLLGILIARLTRGLLVRLAARTTTTWDDILVTRIRGPLAAAWTLVVYSALIPVADLPARPQHINDRVIATTFYLVFFWALLRAIEVVAQVMAASPWAAERPAARSLIPLGTRVLKMLLIIMGTIALVSSFGYPVASLLAGLGIGGLALALAAQKTVENLFGSFSIGVDQPFRVGDFIKVEDVQGNVETVGLRSTRVRTLDRTLVTIPNGKLADMRIETFAVRDRLRLACLLGVTYGTTAAQIRKIVADIEALLRAHPRIWPDNVVVRFKELGSTSLNIDVTAWFQTTDWNEFMLIRQDMLLSFMEIVERAGSDLAFPTQTLHVVTKPAGK